MSRLTKIKIKGFRSIKAATLEVRPLNVLIGANGAGKSNLISFFKLMNEIKQCCFIGFRTETAFGKCRGPHAQPCLDRSCP